MEMLVWVGGSPGRGEREYGPHGNLRCSVLKAMRGTGAQSNAHADTDVTVLPNLQGYVETEVDRKRREKKERQATRAQKFVR